MSTGAVQPLPVNLLTYPRSGSPCFQNRKRPLGPPASEGSPSIDSDETVASGPHSAALLMFGSPIWPVNLRQTRPAGTSYTATGLESAARPIAASSLTWPDS